MRRFITLLLTGMLALGQAAWADIQVNIEGVDDELRENVLAMLSIHEYRNKEDLTEPMVRRLHARAEREIRRALMPYGYYRVHIDASISRADEESWVAGYAIDPGPVVRIDEVEVEIKGDEKARRNFADIAASPPLKPGDRLLHPEYEAFKRQFLDRANSTGYLDAHFPTHRLEVNTETLSARIELVLEPGEQYYFGEIDIQQDILNDEFVRRFVKFEPGEPLDYDKLLDLQYALTDSEYFATVNINTLRGEAEDQHVPIEVIANENKRSRYTAGLGYGTDTGPRLTLGFQRRYVNRRGHRLSMETQFSEVEDSFSTRYIIPLADPTQETLQLFGGTLRQDRGDAESRRLVIGASRVRMLGDWEQTYYLRAEDENNILPDREFDTRILLPGGSWMKTRADDYFYTRKGYKLFGDIRGSHPSLGSNTEFLRLRILGKRIFPLGPRMRVLLRAEAGASLLAESDELPISQRFFAGGDQSVRGFDYNMLATRDADGNVVGGTYLATGSAEIEYRFAESWGVAVFSDTGNAMDNLDTSLETSYGIGLRWLSPVGVLRVDLASPVNSDLESAGSVRLHISIGPDL